MKNDEKPIANPLVVLREDFDDWAVLFDLDTGNAFGTNPVGALIWKLLDGEHTVEDILHELRETSEDVADCAQDHVNEFIAALTGQGLAGDEAQTSQLLWQIPEGRRQTSGRRRISDVGAPKKDADILKYEKPELVDFTSGWAAQGASCNPGSSASPNCNTYGHLASHTCQNGVVPGTGYPCSSGTSVH